MCALNTTKGKLFKYVSGARYSDDYQTFVFNLEHFEPKMHVVFKRVPKVLGDIENSVAND